MPSPKITFRCPTAVLERLTKCCEARGVGQSAGIVMAIERWMSDNSPTPPAPDERITELLAAVHRIEERLVQLSDEPDDEPDDERWYGDEADDLREADEPLREARKDPAPGSDEDLNALIDMFGEQQIPISKQLPVDPKTASGILPEMPSEPPK